MKTFLIAAGLMAAMLGTAPAYAAPLAGAAQQRGGQDTMTRDRGQSREDADRSTNRTDRSGADWNRSDRSGADWNRSDRSRSEWNRSDRRGSDWNHGRRDGRQDRWNNGRGHRYGWNARRCHNERRHHRWVRVCGRR